MAEQYKINGVSVGEYLTAIQRVDGYIGAPPMQQRDYVVPGRTGVIAAKAWSGPRPFILGGVIAGGTRSDYQDKLRDFGNLCFNSGDTFTLSRTLDLTTTTTQTTVATARYVGGLDSVNELSNRVCRLAVEFSLIDGFFFDAAYTEGAAISESAFTIDVPGDAATTEVRVRFTGGSGAQRVTNTTTGDYVEYTGSTSTAVDIDVAKFTAVQGSSSVIANVSSGTASYYWLRLKPGKNNLTRTGNGSVRISYKAAWL